jgi:hypothetical protein
VERDAALVVTEAQWIEHSDGWRWGHLDQAPSVALRRKAIEEHKHQEQLLHAPQASGGLTPWQAWARLPLLTRQAIIVSILVATVVIGAVIR